MFNLGLVLQISDPKCPGMRQGISSFKVILENLVRPRPHLKIKKNKRTADTVYW